MNAMRIAVFVISMASISVIAGSQLPARAAEEPVKIAGSWEGSIRIQGSGLRIVFNITLSGEGVPGGTVDSPDQGARGIPIREITVRGDSLIIDVAAVGGRFAGKYDRQVDVFSGSWNQSSMEFPLELRRSAAPAGPVRPQTPQKPYPYKTEDVSYINEEAGITLAGTLTIPAGGGGFPAVVLITGSGQQNRDEEVFGHRPFLVLADHLTRRGIAVLRTDDRGVGGSGGNPALSTTEDFATDVRAAIVYLKSRPEIDQDGIGLVGHSEGGIIAPMVAAGGADVKFVVLLAAPGLNGSEILISQTGPILREAGLGEELIGKILEQKRLEQDVFIREKDVDKAAEIMIEESTAFMDRYSREERQALDGIGYTEGAIAQRARIYSTPWFGFFLSYDPAPALSRVECPVLALWGEKDIQVPPGENIAAIGKALSAGRCRRYRTLELKGLNHLFQTCQTGSINEYGRITETFAPEALDIISGWVLEAAADRAHGGVTEGRP
ncbi:MAG: alpha/beta hydrolase [Candidatus Krumholzibacteria bacterium]|nr:alpha/beta hydrolase [Candidatus Krumholzibacteria bacterium]